MALPATCAWAKTKAGLFVPLDAELQSVCAGIEANYTDLADLEGVYQSAHGYVIALAKIRAGTVVTQETPAAEKKSAR